MKRVTWEEWWIKHYDIFWDDAFKEGVHEGFHANDAYIDALEAENERLKNYEIAGYEIMHDEMEKTIQKLKEALEFYNQEPIRMDNGAVIDIGEVARTALNELEKGESDGL